MFDVEFGLWQVARATSAAPTYFPPFTVLWGGAERSFVDGGVWANNPAGVAIVESLALTGQRGLTGDSLTLVSLGTGIAPAGATFQSKHSWLGPARDLMGLATSVWAGEVLARRALAPGSFHRLQVVDAGIAGAMDDPSLSRLQQLREAAERTIAFESVTLDHIVNAIATT